MNHTPECARRRAAWLRARCRARCSGWRRRPHRPQARSTRRARAASSLSATAPTPRPFAYTDDGQAGRLRDRAVRQGRRRGEGELKLSALTVDFVPVRRRPARALQQGQIDLLCGAAPTLERRALVDFSIPIMLSRHQRGGACRRRRCGCATRCRAANPSRSDLARLSSDQPPSARCSRWSAACSSKRTLIRALKERRIVADIVTVTDTTAGLQCARTGARAGAVQRSPGAARCRRAQRAAGDCRGARPAVPPRHGGAGDAPRRRRLPACSSTAR